MCLLLINLYELGQFLRIVAWIFIPLLLLITLITVWLHHRKKRSALPAEEPMDGPSGEELLPIESPQEADSPYKGLLWMKHKYEQYCEETDEKMEKIKEKLAAAEAKYLDLLASRPPVSFAPTQHPTSASADPALPESDPTSPDPEAPALIPSASDLQPETATLLLPETPLSDASATVPSPLDQRINNYHELEFRVSEQQSIIDTLSAENTRLSFQCIDIMAKNAELSTQNTEISGQNTGLSSQNATLSAQSADLFSQNASLATQNADLSTKLEHNLRLLTNIHKELNRSLKTEDPDTHENDHAAVPAFSE